MIRVLAFVLLFAAWCALIGAIILAFGPGAAQAALLASLFAFAFIGRSWILANYSARTGRPTKGVTFWDLEWQDHMRSAALGAVLLALGLVASYAGRT